MNAKKQGKPSAKVVVEKAMPGWTVVARPAKDARATRGSGESDAVSPSLAKLKAKALGHDSVKVVKVSELQKSVKAGKAGAQFVTVKPANAMDSASALEKVVLLRDGKVVAQQG